MKKRKIKPLPVVKEFTDYFLRRTQRVLKMKASDMHHTSIDVHPEEKTIWVWVHGKEAIIARAQFTFDGRCYSKTDNRPIFAEKK